MDVSAIYSIDDARRLLSEGNKPNLTTAAGRAAAAAEKQKQIAVAAKQFEAIIVRQLLSPAIKPLMAGGGLGGEKSGADAGGGSNIYSYLVTDAMANCLTQGGGLGLSNILEKQLTPKGSVPAAKAAAVYGTGEAKKS